MFHVMLYAKRLLAEPDVLLEVDGKLFHSIFGLCVSGRIFQKYSRNNNKNQGLIHQDNMQRVVQIDRSLGL